MLEANLTIAKPYLLDLEFGRKDAFGDKRVKNI